MKSISRASEDPLYKENFMYRFQVHATTQPGERIALVGSSRKLGSWDPRRCVWLKTDPSRYPLWWVELPLSAADWPKDSLPEDSGSLSFYGQWGASSPTGTTWVEYQYLRVQVNGEVTWESIAVNRWVPLEPEPLPAVLIVEDGEFGRIPSYPYGYFADPIPEPKTQNPQGLKVVVLGSSVALGCSAWLLRGWVWHLEKALQAKYGYQLRNLSELGANVSRTLARFAQVVIPEQPDIVIVALSLGNEGLASAFSQHRRALQRRFENGLQRLIQQIQDIGALPIIGGVYPHADYGLEQYLLLQETQQRMLEWGCPVLNWLPALDDGQGRWKPGLSFDATHPNSKGHELMFEAIDLSTFDPNQVVPARHRLTQLIDERPIFQDDHGFWVTVEKAKNQFRVINITAYTYTISPTWQALQTAFQKAQVQAGLYLAKSSETTGLYSLFVQEDGSLKTTLSIPADADLSFYPAAQFFSQEALQTIYEDGSLTILKLNDLSHGSASVPRLCVINRTDHEYNIHPMWKEVRAALKAMPAGVYEDPNNRDAPFRTLMIGEAGLESRVKAAPGSAMLLEYVCRLSDINRVAIVPLGDRCAVRMLLYKLEYDGPAFPFDLTRTTNLADVADMIYSDFQGMWDPQYLHYNPEERRIYHSKWTGLSFGHEVEENEDPVHNMNPIYERMRTRYTARSRRFLYVLEKADKILFVRTGSCQREVVIDLMDKLGAKCIGKPFLLLIISPQSPDEFTGIPNVIHYEMEFNPDRMYADPEHWKHCTEIMRNILHSLGISSRNLFWCPPQLS
jgi:lysophospholipase L1-like esterase